MGSRKDIKYPPKSLHSDINDIIQSIFFGETAPSLDDLISLPFFDVNPRGLTAESGEETDMKPEYLEVLSILRGGQPARKKKQRKPPAPSTSAAAPVTPTAATEPLISSQPIPAPPPPSSRPSNPPPATSDRASLLSAIRTAGGRGAAQLKKVEAVNDRSAPRL